MTRIAVLLLAAVGVVFGQGNVFPPSSGGGGGGSMTWPSSPGLTVCTGTPCTAWGTSIAAPTGSLVGAGQSNSFTAGVQSFAASNLTLPTASGFVATAVNNIGIDSATGYEHLWWLGVDRTLGTAALANTGTSGAVVPLLNQASWTFQPTSDSTTAFQIQNHAGPTTIFDVDTTNGRVGIGTTSPANMLDVAGVISSGSAANYWAGELRSYWGSGLYVSLFDNSTLGEVGLQRAGQPDMFVAYNTASGNTALNDTFNGGNIVFNTNVGGTMTQRATILNNGNVGIGTNSPVSKLSIPVAPTATANYGLVSRGSAPFDGITTGFFTGNSLGTVDAINAASGYGGDLADWQVAGVKEFSVSAYGAAYVAGGLSSAGNISAGSTGAYLWASHDILQSPADGQLEITNHTTTGAGLAATNTGDVSACYNGTSFQVTYGSVCGTSLEETKTNLQPLQHGLDYVMALQPITFDQSGASHIGFGARQVASIDPLLGAYQGGELYNVTDRAILASVVKAVQELQQNKADKK